MYSPYIILKVNPKKSEIKRELITGSKKLVVGRFLGVVGELGK